MGQPDVAFFLPLAQLARRHGVAEAEGHELHRLALLLSVGFLGSFSTFSTFVVELLQALGEGQAGEALRLAGFSVGGGLLALELGRRLGGL